MPWICRGWSHTGTCRPRSEVTDGAITTLQPWHIGANLGMSDYSGFTVMSQGTEGEGMAVIPGWGGTKTTVGFLTQALPASSPWVSLDRVRTGGPNESRCSSSESRFALRGRG